jgi:hypothetical protein
MKNIKFGVLAFGVLGILSLFIPMEGFTLFSMLKATSMVDLVIILVGFGVPIAVGVMGMSKPFKVPMAAAALVGFGLIAVKSKIWTTLPHIMDLPGIGFKLFIVAQVGGIVCAAIALAKPEEG